jgi:hypothetical protein
MKLLLAAFLMLTPVFASHDDGRVIDAAKHSEIVIVAEVVEVQPAVGFWSGVFASVQHVRYRVLETLKGKVQRDDIDAGHYVVANSLTADRKTPQLSPALFKPGNRLVLMLSSDRGHACKLDHPPSGIEAFCSPNENTGATIATDVLLEQLRDVLR